MAVPVPRDSIRKAPGDLHKSRLARDASRALLLLAVVGVPLGLLWVTGGWRTVGFWATAVIWVPVSFFGAFPIGVIILLVAIPFLWLLDKRRPGRAESVIERAALGFWVSLWAAGYVWGADVSASPHVRLPLPSVTASALLLLSCAVLASCGLIALRRRIEGRRRRPMPLPPSFVPEPAVEFWSAEEVVAWRAWTWHAGTLFGVRAKWLTDTLEAECGQCNEVPSWGHSCGIYGLRSAADIDLFVNNANVVGTIEMWGSVIEHENGYRASHARIVELWVASGEIASELSEAFPGVPVRVGTPLTRREGASWPR